jgi:hypothetical protein
MSRHSKKLTEHITIWYGNDHAIGKWFDVHDSRAEDIDDDGMNEGYVYEWSQIFPKGTNLIGYEKPDIFELTDDDEMTIIIQKCDEYINKLNQKN